MSVELISQHFFHCVTIPFSSMDLLLRPGDGSSFKGIHDHCDMDVYFLQGTFGFKQWVHLHFALVFQLICQRAMDRSKSSIHKARLLILTTSPSMCMCVPIYVFSCLEDKIFCPNNAPNFLALTVEGPYYESKVTVF